VQVTQHYLVAVLVVAFDTDIVHLLSKLFWLKVELPVENASFFELVDRDRNRGVQLMRLSAVGIEVVVKIGAHCCMTGWFV
jgi:hypothetical protein